MTTPYGFTTTLRIPYQQAIEQTIAVLKEEGFGVLTEIDVQDTLKKKLNVDFQRYIILGACNPPLAYQALQVEPEVGLLLPCNVIVYEAGASQSVVSVVDPLTMLGIVENESLATVAEEAKSRLVRVVEKLSQTQGA